MKTENALHPVLQCRQGLGYASRNDLALVEITGADCAAFLQNRSSNDVLALQPGKGHLNSILDRSAHVQSIFSLYRCPSPETTGPSFWMLLPSEFLTQTLTELKRYQIMETVHYQVFENQWEFLSVQGPQAFSVLQRIFPQLPFTLSSQTLARTLVWFDLAQSPTQQNPKPDCFLMSEPFSDLPSLLLGVPKHKWNALQHALEEAAAVALSPSDLDVLRVEAGIPNMEKDIPANTLLPETGLAPQTVSYTKGCYLGQETVARVKTYGSLQKALSGVKLPHNSAIPSPNQPILVDGQCIGHLHSVVYSPTLSCPIGFAYLNREYRTPEAEYTAEIGRNVSQITISTLPFLQKLNLEERSKALLTQGLHCFAKDQEEEAIAHLEQSIAIDPNCGDAYEALGVILSRQNTPEALQKAIQLMNTLLILDPDRIMAHTNLSIYYMKLGDKERAEDEKAKATLLAMKRATQAAAQQQEQAAERLKREQLTRDRILLFQQALQSAPDDPLGNFGLGTAYLELQEFENALGPLQKVLAAQPTHTVAYLSLGKAFEALSRQADAIDIYQRGITVAAKRGDRQPMAEMQSRLQCLMPPESA